MSDDVAHTSDESDTTGAALDSNPLGERITRDAAATALALFGELDSLTIESKGRQDWVSEADRNVETQIRAALTELCPDDAIVGEEHENTPGTSGYVWVIDPIDGTTLFVTGTPGWCVTVACCHAGETVLGFTVDPIADECFAARRGHGATLNNKAVSCSAATSLEEGSVSLGHSARMPTAPTLAALTALLEAGGMYQRTGSGALCLAYVAAGRLIGYLESHMNAWDCVGGLLLIEEAGGRVAPFDHARMLERGGRVVAGGTNVYASIEAIANDAYGAPD